VKATSPGAGLDRHAVERSEIYARLSRRGARQMPPLATSVTDDEALAVLRRWIAEL